MKKRKNQSKGIGSMPIIDIVERINAGTLDPKILDKPERQECVELLYSHGYGVPQMAKILRCCNRTIRRDIRDIRRRNALSPSVDFSKEIAGWIYQAAENTFQRMNRMVVNGSMPDRDRGKLMFLYWRGHVDVVNVMLKLGYLQECADSQNKHRRCEAEKAGEYEDLNSGTRSTISEMLPTDREKLRKSLEREIFKKKDESDQQ
jgi:hypothetical protein